MVWVWILTYTIVILFLLFRGDTLRKLPFTRVLCSCAVIMLSIRYLLWRWTLPIPTSISIIGQIYCYIYLVLESFNLLNSMITAFWLSRTINRSSIVDSRPHSPMLQSAVDVFIPTYNESQDILVRTIVGALNIDHPDLRVWVLDDGNRPNVRELAENLGCFYVARVNGKHAKAGNINNGLAHALATGRTPQFITVFDADFVAYSNFLKRTLPLFEEDDVGIVQTPQHFFNRDPVQTNLDCIQSWPDEQRFFFNYLLESKDAFGAAFCCGTGAVLRVEALKLCHGMATATVTEDMLTSFSMREHGYRTILLNERLSVGLAPENLSEYVSQRCRWALGAIQQLYTRWAPWGTAPVGWANRLSSFDTMLFWGAFFEFKLLLISAPAVYWLTGYQAVNTTFVDLIENLAPLWITSSCVLAILSGKTLVPVIGEINLLIVAPSICRTLAKSIFKPFGRAFKVTNKGVTSNGITIQWEIMYPFLFLLAVTVIGTLLAINPFGPVAVQPTLLAVTWTCMSVLILSAACAVCIEPAKRRKEERFYAHEPISIITDTGETISGELLDISLGGARILCALPQNQSIQSLCFCKMQINVIKTQRYQNNILGIQFTTDLNTKKEMIPILYSNAFIHDDLQVNVTGTIKGWFEKLLN